MAMRSPSMDIVSDYEGAEVRWNVRRDGKERGDKVVSRPYDMRD